jgi:hypothetical protein
METLPDDRQRVSVAERELAISRMQEAYIQGRLSEHELGERIDRALAAVLRPELSGLVSDLPAIAPPAPSPIEEARSPWWRRRRGRKVARSEGRKGYDVYKSTIRKNGAWAVPALFRSRVYKGELILDLRQATLSSAETVLELEAYKSRLLVLVLPEYKVELEGSAYKGIMENRTTGGLPGGPRILIRCSPYKGSIIVDTRG